MHFPLTSILLPILSSPAASSSLSSPPSSTPVIPPIAGAPGNNPFHIFNAIHSSMRQWGSSLNHNGMTFFLATVPEGTELYHGRGGNAPVKGMEWLAFEPEHAQQFARSRGSGPPGRGGPGTPPGRGDDDDDHYHDEDDRRQQPSPNSKKQWLSGKVAPPLHEEIEGHGRYSLPKHLDRSHTTDAISDWQESRSQEDKSGYLHTYITNKRLQLLYLDGMSAGKTSNGTLDSQDYVLVNQTSAGDGFQEYERGNVMCNISRDHWSGRVHGFLRMEAGFEIILCDFARDLDVRYVELAHGECKDCVAEEGAHGFNYVRAVADRYDTIGEGRVKVNFERFVTAFALDDDLFAHGGIGPRLTGLSDSTLLELRAQITELVLSEPDPFESSGTNWQGIADIIVQRYAARLKYLAMPDIINDEGRLNYELDSLLSSSIDYSNRSFYAEVDRCARKYLPKPSSKPSLAETTVTYVNRYICHKLASAQLPDAPKKDIINTIIESLAWTEWKKCGPCGYDEICSIPIWPFGSRQDWEKPTCRNATSVNQQGGYWGRWGPGGGGGGPGGRRPGNGNGPPPGAPPPGAPPPASSAQGQDRHWEM